MTQPPPFNTPSPNTHSPNTPSPPTTPPHVPLAPSAACWPLLQAYWDDGLTAEQHQQLEQFLQTDPQVAREFVALARLHDQLTNHGQLSAVDGSSHLTAATTTSSDPHVPTRSSRVWSRRQTLLLATLLTVLIALTLLPWQMLTSDKASAAAVELQRIITRQSHSIDRTFLIVVEESRQERSADAPPEADSPLTKSSAQATDSKPLPPPPKSSRPPKPSIDQATIDVRGANQFVLKRFLPQGELFITGSDGQSSWAVRPDGPVRVSRDWSTFNHDVPGHEQQMPLSNLRDGLEQLSLAYEISASPIDSTWSAVAAESAVEPCRLLVATRKPKFRGPRRVEILYGAHTGGIRELRFIGMPYGPEKLTLRMTLIAERDLGADYYQHASHHSSHRVVELED